MKRSSGFQVLLLSKNIRRFPYSDIFLYRQHFGLCFTPDVYFIFTLAAFSLRECLSTSFFHSRLREPRIWRCAPGGGTRSPTGSRPGWRRSPGSTVAGQWRGLRRDECSASTGGPEETAPAGGSVRNGCAARWSRLRKGGMFGRKWVKIICKPLDTCW